MIIKLIKFIVTSLIEASVLIALLGYCAIYGIFSFFFLSKRLVSGEKAGAISEIFAEQFPSIYVGQTLEQASSNFVCFCN